MRDGDGGEDGAQRRMGPGLPRGATRSLLGALLEAY